ncbi:hypothetical protein E2562_034685 [Oryza meyeriana var. granulata]|uniref:Uncharacterized protein n=1 Tax=Oryza meyeriana var. granulata TaxID=110450 RepID=A0A6G1C2C6_9ORYZ|nr:hypothetical protein E2562_034685 [Oryza meyeriana var. granulata]
MAARRHLYRADLGTVGMVAVRRGDCGEAVEHDNVPYHEDGTALEAILRVVLSEMISTLAVKGSTKEALDVLKIMQLNGLVSQLTVLGDTEQGNKVVEKYLQTVHPRFPQHVLSIETLLDISTLSFEDMTGRLKMAKEQGPSSGETNAAKKLSVGVCYRK